jgi:hypothetical protein
VARFEFPPRGNLDPVTLGVSLILVAVGAVLTWAVHPAHEGSVDPNTVGVILMIVGLVAFLLDVMLWSEWGPGYIRRRSVVSAADPAYPAGYSYRRAWPRRRAAARDEVVEPPAGPPVL